MLGQNQTEIHQFDVCGRVYYRGVNYTEKEGELAVETVEATSHDEAEAMFKSLQDEYARECNRTVERIDITFTIDLTIAESDNDEPYLVM
ncbi:hypothetical protein ACI5OG_004584 [Salmonella enterica subsp. enterica serovar Derby]|jgi:hypothetical protein|uniref:S015 n=2 Tax=Enterobacterales TaxID=91347 RepID=A0A3W0B144_SALDE|nr:MULTISPECIES: hypothetical protein [Gammaproteobacteria]EAW2260776.1 hypothetical protein [Salmonella enterica subsp. enterica]EAY2769713.1 hypothetical protein [Salmonella enterica subsp. enterica serovar Typhimurium]EBE3863024.1 hypothetical protein [Salmonella enterica subsp. enterica serovar Agona]EDS5962887.1 hypothetical protein [Salmonella enterica subsp. enterica serovar Berta]EDW8049787.1 hypothetical protein [Salmonella enterica subsp. enterica serovar Javiana]MCL8784608.1 hypoth